MQSTFRRIFMQNRTEGWLIYNEVGEQYCVDVAVIVFSKTKNRLYLFSNSVSRLDNVDYLTTVCNLVHDLPTDFELIKEVTDEEPIEIPMEILIKKSTESNGDL